MKISSLSGSQAKSCIQLLVPGPVWTQGPGMILASAPGRERSAGSSLIDTQVRLTRDLAVIFTAYESAS